MRRLIAGAAAIVLVAGFGAARADDAGGRSTSGAPATQPMPAPSLDWMLGQWRAAADSETPQLELMWTKSATGLHGELAEIASDGRSHAVATYDITPADGTWGLSLREGLGVYRFTGKRMGDEYVRFSWKSSPPERARLAYRAKRTKAGRGGLGPLVSSESVGFLELRHTRGQLMFRLVFGPVRRAPRERSYWFSADAPAAKR